MLLQFKRWHTKNGDYMGSLNKRASGVQCFIMALGFGISRLAYLEHPMVSALLNLRSTVSSCQVPLPDDK